MKTYTFKVVIREGSDEFWESLQDKTGCDEVHKLIKELICDPTCSGFTCDGDYPNCEIVLVEFKDDCSKF